jgi:mannosyltransferase PIG-V
MRTVGGTQVISTLDRSVAPQGLRVRLTRWTEKPGIRTALVAVLALRLTTSACAALAVIVLHDRYLRAVNTAYATASSLHVFVVPPPLHGLAEYLTGPWMRWDANYYCDIAFRGYVQERSTAFLPLYPGSIRLGATTTGGDVVAAGMLISTVATLACFVSLYRLTERLTGSTAAARMSVVSACLLPVAFFLMAPYTEALFLALSLAAILAALDRRWGRASILAALASLTRQQGVLLAVLALPELWSITRRAWSAGGVVRHRAWRWAHHSWQPLLVMVAPPLALGAWLLFLKAVAHQPTPAELLTGSNGWRQHFTLPGLGDVSMVRILLANPADVLLHHVDIPLDAGAAIAAAWGLFAARKRLPVGLLLYLTLSWCASVAKVTEIETTPSASRYLLALLPLCLLPGIWLARAEPVLRFAVMIPCWIVAAWLFLNWILWGWVA